MDKGIYPRCAAWQGTDTGLSPVAEGGALIDWDRLHELLDILGGVGSFGSNLSLFFGRRGAAIAERTPDLADGAGVQVQLLGDMLVCTTLQFVLAEEGVEVLDDRHFFIAR
ncbi:hypothetical protein DYB28_006859 [Aphanomyces astaci]|uniref:Uncharacterized protein n=1 Tax=Aphanomyces astaci TaxID=112090 RepID=A0A9X8E920_APHAT|nr:hypothetical protein DYB28_006859 [Aphanomyces astaci]